MASRILALAAALMFGAAGAGIAEAAPSALPVPYELPDAAEVELTNPGGSPPGSNDPTCRPGADKPNPVILVHNTTGSRQLTWQTFAPLLANEGYCVFALTYGTLTSGSWPVDTIGGLGPIARSAQQLSSFVDEVLTETGAEKVDVLSHSQGTLVAAHWIRFLDGAQRTERAISLAPLWEGTHVVSGDGLMLDVQYAACPACAEMAPGSRYLEEFADADPFVDAVSYTNILTTHDDVVQPYTSGYADAPNVTNIVLQDICASAKTSHLGMLADRLTAALVRSTLDPGSPEPSGCIPSE